METKQHWLSKTYLKNFSPDKFPGQIYEIKRLESKSILKSISEHVAFGYDYNIIEVDGEKKNDYEKVISELESKVGRILRKIKLHRFDLTRDEWSHMIYYMTYLRLNIPQFRKSIEKFEEDVARKIIKTLASDKNLMQSYVQRIDMDGIDKSKINIDELIAFGKDDSRYKIKVPKESAIFAGIRQHENLFKVFALMDWTFHIVADDSYLITTDMPVVPIVKDWKMPFTPGYGIADKTIFPVTKKICLVGQQKQFSEKERNLKVNGQVVNTINHILIGYSHEHLYSPINLKELNKQFEKFPIV